MKAFKRHTRIGQLPIGSRNALVDVIVTIEWTGDRVSITKDEVPATEDIGRLSISGVEGPKANGDAWGGCGQIRLGGFPFGKVGNDGFKPAPGVDVARLFELWDRWHLNDMRPGCEHQRAEGWGEAEVELVTYKLTGAGHYYKLTGAGHYEVDRREKKRVGWVREDEHPQGVLSKACPVCGYKYGTAWLKEEVPADVLRWLYELPENGDLLPGCWRR